MRGKPDGDKEVVTGWAVLATAVRYPGRIPRCSFLPGWRGCARDLWELSTDSLDVTKDSLKNGSGGTGTADKLLHEALERGYTGFPGETSTVGTIQRRSCGGQRGRFDGGGRDGGGELLYTTLYCRVPNMPYELLETRSCWRFGCNLSRRIS